VCVRGTDISVLFGYRQTDVRELAKRRTFRSLVHMYQKLARVPLCVHESSGAWTFPNRMFVVRVKRRERLGWNRICTDRVSLFIKEAWSKLNLGEGVVLCCTFSTSCWFVLQYSMWNRCIRYSVLYWGCAAKEMVQHET